MVSRKSMINLELAMREAMWKAPDETAHLIAVLGQSYPHIAQKLEEIRAGIAEDDQVMNARHLSGYVPSHPEKPHYIRKHHPSKVGLDNVTHTDDGGQKSYQEGAIY